MSDILNRLGICMVGLLLGAAMVLCVVLLVLRVTRYMIDTIKDIHIRSFLVAQHCDIDKVTKNCSILGRCIIIDRDDILALLVGCVVGFILGVAMP